MGENIRINNVNVEDNINFVYAMTGYAAKTEDEKDTKINNNVYKWTTKDGTVASNTGTIYGVMICQEEFGKDISIDK